MYVESRYGAGDLCKIHTMSMQNKRGNKKHTQRVTTVYIYYIKGIACRGLTFSQGVQVHSCGTQR